jgi:lysophospholipase L1-like esterase
MQTILCFGDSNTWGYNPETAERYAPDVRWTGVLARKLGAGFRVIEEGLNGRTSVWEDPLHPGRNGSRYLGPCLESHRPLDLVVLFLGLNDLKKRFSASADDIAKGVGVLAEMVARSGAGPGGAAPRMLLVAPPPVGRLTGFAEAFEGSVERSRRVAEHLRPIARQIGCDFLDAAEHVCFSDVDGIHFDAAAHAALGAAFAARIRESGPRS